LKANSGTFVDSRDKKTYKTIKIGTQTWLAENLTFNAKDSKCYNNNPAGCEKYGRLYDWQTALTSCPSGWHLPTDAEWGTLVATVGDSAGYKLKAKSSYGGGSDEYSFSAVLGGIGFSNQNYKNDAGYGFWWAATESKDKEKAYSRWIGANGTDAASDEKSKKYLLSVRCLKGEPGPEAKAAAAAQPAQPAQPAAKEQPKQQASTESCTITFPKKACIEMPKGTCKMTGGKVVDKCP